MWSHCSVYEIPANRNVIRNNEKINKNNNSCKQHQQQLQQKQQHQQLQERKNRLTVDTHRDLVKFSSFKKSHVFLFYPNIEA